MRAHTGAARAQQLRMPREHNSCGCREKVQLLDIPRPQPAAISSFVSPGMWLLSLADAVSIQRSRASSSPYGLVVLEPVSRCKYGVRSVFPVAQTPRQRGRVCINFWKWQPITSLV